MHNYLKKINNNIWRTVMVIVIMLGMTNIAFTRVYESAEELCQQQMEQLAIGLSLHVEQYINSDQEDLVTIADILNIYPDLNSQEAVRILDSFHAHDTSEYVGILLPDNNVILPPNKKYPIAEKMDFNEEAAKKAHITSRLTNSDGSGHVLLDYVPITDANGNIRAMLFGVINLQTIVEKWNLLTYRSSIYGDLINVFVLDAGKENGEFLVDTMHNDLYDISTIYQQDFAGENDVKVIRTEEIRGKRGVFSFFSNDRSEQILFFHNPIKVNDWLATVSLPEKAAYKTAVMTRDLLTVMFVMESIVLLLYFGYMFYREREERSREMRAGEKLKNAMLDAKAANKAKSTFLSSVSHDIRTPMNAILGFTKIASLHISNEDRVKDCLDKINISGNHLLKLINNVLDLSKIESGKIELQETACNIKEICENLRSMVQSNITNNGLVLDMDYSGVKEYLVYGDALRLNQVMINIVGNSIKFTPHGGKISVKVTQRGSQRQGYGNYVFSFRDTGIGMSKEFLPHVFDSFERDKNVAAQNLEGSGLGMSIVKNIISLMEGTITVESELGAGTEFTIFLPMRLQENQEEGGKASAENIITEVDFKGYRILLVEDNELNREIAEVLLEEAGFDVETAENGLKAVEMMTNNEAGYYSLILMDIQMPIMNGYDATRAIRKMDDYGKSGIPIVAMTADAFEEDRKRSLRRGMNGHIAKPIDLKELFDCLQVILGQRGA